MGGRGSGSGGVKGRNIRLSSSTRLEFNNSNVKKIIFKRDNGMTFVFEKTGVKNNLQKYKVKRSDGMEMESIGNDLLWRVASTTAKNGGYVRYE